MKKPGSGWESSTNPWGGTEPQEWTLGSMSGARARRGFDDLVEVESELTQRAKVGAQPGGDDDLVERPGFAVGVGDGDAVVGARRTVGPEVALDADDAFGHEGDRRTRRRPPCSGSSSLAPPPTSRAASGPAMTPPMSCITMNIGADDGLDPREAIGQGAGDRDGRVGEAGHADANQYAPPIQRADRERNDVRAARTHAAVNDQQQAHRCDDL